LKTNRQIKELTHLLKAIWLVLLLVIAVLGLSFAWAIISTPLPNIVAYEQNVIVIIQQMLDGQPIYTNPEQPPYNIVQYTPLYFILVEQLANLFNIVPDELLTLIRLARTISTFFALLTALLLGIVAYIHSKRLMVAVPSAILAFLLPMPWAFLARPDALLYFFTLLSLILFWRYNIQKSKGNRLSLLLAGASFALAILAKHNAVGYLLMMLLFPFYYRQILDRFILLSGTILAIILLSLLFGNYYSLLPAPDNFFYTNIIDGVRNGAVFFWMLGFTFRSYLQYYALFFFLPMLSFWILWRELRTAQTRALPIRKGLAAYWNFLRDYDRSFIVWLYFFACFTSYGIITSLKFGSNVNYMMESILVSIPVIILTVKHYLSHSKDFQKPIFTTLAAILVVLIAVLMLWKGMAEHGAKINATIADVYNQNLIEDLGSELESYPESYFVSLIEDRVLNLVFYKRVFFPQTEIYAISPFDFASLNDVIADGRLRYIITDKQAPLPDILWGASTASFELLIDAENYQIYQNSNSP
jgi:hypothetical protein